MAELLAGLCTNSVPGAVCRAAPGLENAANAYYLKNLYRPPHLPQGAPSSPALANLAAFRMDRRLAGLANKAGARYTRYADDLVFSGGTDFARAAGRFEIGVARIALEEGFEIQSRKNGTKARHGVIIELSSKLVGPVTQGTWELFVRFPEIWYFKKNGNAERNHRSPS